MRFGFGCGRAGDLAAAATYLGLSQSTLQADLQSGKTLAQIADATDGKSSSGLIDALVTAEQAELAAAVTAGTITQAQADQITATLKDRFTNMVNGTMPSRGGYRGGPASASAAAAISPQRRRISASARATLQADLQSGKTLAQIADATNGKSSSGLIDALVTAEQAELAAAVTAGTITQAQADQITATLKDRFTNMVNGTRPLRGGYGGGLGPRLRAPLGLPRSRAAARTSSAAQARGRRPAPVSPSPGGTAFHGLEHPCGNRSPKRHLLAIARTRSRDSLVVSLRQPAARRQRPRARGRPEPLHDTPLHLDARRARLPAAGSCDEEVPARPAGARPRVLGDQLDGPARGRRAPPAGAERRDRPHREHGGARRRRHRLHRAVPHLPERPARHRPEPAHRLAPPRVLHVDGQGAARRARERPAASKCSSGCGSRRAARMH